MMKIEDYFTPWEIFEAMKTWLLYPRKRRLYRGAPSEALRRYYVLDACESFAISSGRHYEEVEEHIRDIMTQYEDALSIEDWKYEASNTYNTQYLYACRDRIKKLKARQQAGEQPIGEE